PGRSIRAPARPAPSRGLRARRPSRRPRPPPGPPRRPLLPPPHAPPPHPHPPPPPPSPPAPPAPPRRALAPPDPPHPRPPPVHPPPTPVLAPVHVLVLVLVLDPARLPCREAYSVLVLVLDPATRPYREGRPVLILDPVRWPCREGPLVSIPPHGSFPAMICSRSSGRVNSPSADGAGTWHWRQFARSGCVVRISATAPGPPWQTRQLPRRWRSCGMKGGL